jgi:hypothetical protein
MNTPLHYLIFHPERYRQRFDVRGTALRKSGTVEPWSGTVWADSERGNQDPYIWHEPWLYSFCHADTLQHTVPKHRVDVGSKLFFCDTHEARKGNLRVDTVFVVSTREPWTEIGAAVPERFAALQTARDAPVWTDHFRHGLNARGSRKHVGALTYTASHDELGGSFLPLVEAQPPVVRAREVLADPATEALIKTKASYRPTKPCILSPPLAETLYRWLGDHSDTMVLNVKRQ